MAHDSRAVANEILKIGREKGISMSMMKLIKLVYFAHAWMLGLTGKPLCSDPVEAWKYGPVFRELYGNLPYKGSEIIRAPICNYLNNKPYIEEFTGEEKEIISNVVNAYGKINAFGLSDLTHRIGTPWYHTVKENGYWGEIDNALIQQYYGDKVRKNDKEELG